VRDLKSGAIVAANRRLIHNYLDYLYKWTRRIKTTKPKHNQQLAEKTKTEIVL
tara:strand:- start:48 stop:206 length:159 start_codon:yes stop_codon:yes gene_type:complete